MKIGIVIKRRREAEGWTQEALADQANVHRVYMGTLERGKKNVTLPTLSKLAKALGIPTWQLVREAEEEG